MVFKIIKSTIRSMINKNTILAYDFTYFGQAKNYIGQVKVINYLPGMASQFWNLCWCLDMIL